MTTPDNLFLLNPPDFSSVLLFLSWRTFLTSSHGNAESGFSSRAIFPFSLNPVNNLFYSIGNLVNLDFVFRLIQILSVIFITIKGAAYFTPGSL